MLVTYAILLIGTGRVGRGIAMSRESEDKPKRTSTVTWIALVVIVVFILGDLLAVLIPAY
jgi:hypothetical protein